MNNHLENYPQALEEIQNIALKNGFSLPQEAKNNPLEFGRSEIDRRFGGDFGPIFLSPEKEVNFNALLYQARGEAASFFLRVSRSGHS